MKFTYGNEIFDVSNKFKYLAVDKNGEVYAYSIMPTYDAENEWWFADCQYELQAESNGFRFGGAEALVGEPNKNLIVAVSKNGVCGANGALPWRLPSDLLRFKTLTLNKPIIMGRKTFESLPGVLPFREHHIVTRDWFYSAKAPRGVLVHNSLDGAFENVGECFVIGGAEIYRQALPYVDQIFLTLVDAEIEGDATFPLEEVLQSFKKVHHSKHHGLGDQYSTEFMILVR